MAATPSFFEPFRNPVTTDEIFDCLLKWLTIRGQFKRAAKRSRPTNSEGSIEAETESQADTPSAPLSLKTIPTLWILTPTASDKVLSSVPAIAAPQKLPGFYFITEQWKVNIVVIHQLSPTEETLWLRVLGRDNVQKRAIEELETMTQDNPFRQPALELLYNLRQSLKLRKDIDLEDRELIMRLEPFYQRDRTRLQQETKQEIALNLLRMGMTVEQVSQGTGLSVEEVTQLRDQSENSERSS